MLRFKKPDGSEYPAWDNKKISEFTSVFSASRVHKEEWQTEGIPFWRSSDVMAFHQNKKNNMGEVFISRELYERLSAKSGKIMKDDILITGGGSIGMPYIVPEDDSMYVKDADLLCIRKSSTHYTKYLFHFFMSEGFRKYLAEINHKGSIAHYTITQINETSIPLPCIEEQQKIADCLSSVDAVIADYEAQVENMQNQKKGVMQKLFSQEVRFKADDGGEYPAWEEKTIGECCDILDSKRKPITKQYREKGPYPYYGATNIQDYVSGYLFDEPLVLMAEDGGPFNDYLNKPIAQWAEGKFWVNNHAHVLRPYGNRKFMFYVLVHKDIRNYINNPGRGKLNQEDMRKIAVPQPCLEEQQKITDCLSAFDNAIEDLQKTVEHWKNIKKGLLQQLFA